MKTPKLRVDTFASELPSVDCLWAPNLGLPSHRARAQQLDRRTEEALGDAT